MPLPVKLGQMYDAKRRSNIEILFQFLEEFDEVPLADSIYTMKDGIVLEKTGDRWSPCRAEINHFMNWVRDFTSDDWTELKRQLNDNIVHHLASR